MGPPQAAASTIQPDRAPRVGPAIEHLFAQGAIHVRQVPTPIFLVGTVRTRDLAQPGERLDSRTTCDRRGLLPLDQALAVQLLLQFDPASAGRWFGPLLRHAVAAFDLAIVLRRARRDPCQVHAQPEQP